MSENNWAMALQEFIYIGGWLLLIIAAVSVLTGVVRHYVPQEKLQSKLQQHESRGPIIGGLMGILTPFCSAAMIPVMIGMVQMGVATGTVFSFLISAPLTNFVVVGLIMATFGLKIAAIYFALTLSCAIAAGYIIGCTSLKHAVKRDLVEPEPSCGNAAPASVKDHEVEFIMEEEDKALAVDNCSGAATCAAPTADADSHKEKLKRAMRFAWALFKKITPYVLIGAAISALSAVFLPADIVEKYVGNDNWFAIPVAAVISVPLYLRIEMALPLLDVLIGKGMGMGAAMALLIGGTGASLPEIAIVSTVLKPRAVVAFVTIVLAMAIFGGVLFSLIL
ncbi:permease [Gilvimarinus agarilyticus]|uniref:permease n=1 Tax=Gilvimarinus sp. 2_MG-2023 TaxID=3062666 RepID=UPI001C08456E|nr:permease [Gilvimarinus sp. 2_MG-2023]MBU2884614.1 permease [Gilvimarinus agarilyticus]MDO6569723.1 permease [Gilvimarinus sp. 2_MG-2023]